MSAVSVNDVVGRLAAATTLEEVGAEIEAIASACGARWHVKHYGLLSYDAQSYNNTMFRAAPICLHNFPDAWSERYHVEGLYRVDPVARRCFRDVLPVLWHVAEAEADDAGRIFFDWAREHGLQAGITVPVHAQNGEFGALGLAYDQDTPDIRAHIEAIQTELHLLAFHIRASMKRVLSAAVSTTSKIHLTPREQEILTWTASGKTTWEIGQILAISERTAKQHLGAVIRKLGVQNKYHAVAEAVARGLTRAF